MMTVQPLVRATVLVAVAFALLASSAIAVGAQEDEDSAAESMTVRLTVLEELQREPVDDMGTLRTAETLSHGRVTAFADGAECASIEPRGNESEIVIGLPEQPEECRREGARIAFDNGHGGRMIETFEFESGETVDLTNYALPPPPSDGGVAPPAPAEAGGLGTPPAESPGALTGIAAALLVLAGSVAIRAGLRGGGR